MSAAFTRASKTRVPYRRSWKPTVEDMERRIVDRWFSLCSSVNQGRDRDARIDTTLLHDYGVIYHKAKLREGLPA